MEQNRKNYTLASFKAYCIPMILFSVCLILFAVVSFAGIRLPLNAQNFEGSDTIRIVSVAAGVLGIIASCAGMKSAKTKNGTLLKICGVLGFIVIIMGCAMMILADGHTNPHVWILLGMTSIIPGGFGGTAIRLAIKGWDD